jgi:glycerophosphoryl diester phosphodiesterase
MMTKPVRIYAHRGASAELPENTMPAFRKALELGADALELDIHATRDGVLVVSHDPDGERMAGVPRQLADVTWQDARHWNAGAGFVAPDGSRPFAGSSIPLPTFEQVLVEFPGIPLNVDLKHDLAEATVAMLRRFGAEERTCLASFQVRTMRRVRALGYAGPTALSRAEALTALALPSVVRRGRFRTRAARAQLPTSLGRAWVVARMHALGLHVDYWTVDDPTLAQRLVALGADGIMTNDPRRIVPALRSAPSQAAL